MNIASVEFIQLIIKIGLLIFFGLYVVVAIVFYRQIGKLEKWLESLKRYHLDKMAKVHLVMAIVGWFLALLIFTI